MDIGLLIPGNAHIYPLKWNQSNEDILQQIICQLNLIWTTKNKVFSICLNALQMYSIRE